MVLLYKTILEAILKYRKHPSIIATESRYRDASSFRNMEVSVGDIRKWILNLNGNKGYQNSDMPTKVIKENSDIFSSFLCTSFNSSIKTSKILNALN